MMDEYSKLTGQYTPGDHRQTGGGGSLGRAEATGYGVVYNIREAMQHSLDEKRRHPGFGNVAQSSLWRSKR